MVNKLKRFLEYLDYVSDRFFTDHPDISVSRKGKFSYMGNRRTAKASKKRKRKMEDGSVTGNNVSDKDDFLKYFENGEED